MENTKIQIDISDCQTKGDIYAKLRTELGHADYTEEKTDGTVLDFDYDDWKITYTNNQATLVAERIEYV